MTDTDKLKRLAEAVKTDGGRWDDWQEFRRLTSPDSILALIRNLDAEKGRLERERDEAVALLRETEGIDFEITDLDVRIDAFLTRIDAAD